jgi:hypothetical protein
MRHMRLTILTLTAVALASACGDRPMNGGGGGGTSGTGGSGGGTTHTGGGTGNTGGGTGNTGGGSGATGGGTGAMGGGSGATGGGGNSNCTVATVTNAINSAFMYENACVEIDNAVVVGATTPYMSTSTGCVGNMMTETFYIQDNNAPAGSPGLAVYKSCKDNITALPNVGDIVSVSGRFSQFDGSLQISTSTKYMMVEQLAVTGSGGMSASGAYPPSGMPIAIAGTDMTYAHNASSGDPHHDQLGMALKFTGVTVKSRYPMGFNATKADGGVTPEGFELSNGVWVDDSQVYHNCSASIPGDGGTFANGIKGFWDRYQDFYGSTKLADGGYQNAPVLPVLVPLTCADLM